MTAAFLTLRDIKIECVDRGAGRPIVFLHPHLGLSADDPILSLLAQSGRVVAPAHPGFGRSDLPKRMTTIDDIAYLYLDLMKALDLRDITIVGASMGGFIAAQMAIKSTARIAALVLLNPVGIRVGDRETRDFADMFAMVEEEFLEAAFHDPAKGRRDYKGMADDDVTVAARNREAAAHFLWSPYMHDIKLKGRLHRIDVPTLVLWGASDRLASVEYGRAYAAAIPGAHFEVVADAGHFPHVEAPRAVADAVAGMMTGGGRAVSGGAGQ